MKKHLVLLGLFPFIWCTALTPFSQIQAVEIPLPETLQVENFVKEKIPSHFKFSTLQISSHDVSGKTLSFRGKLTVSVQEHLYREVTNEVPEIANAPKTGIEPPIVLKKLHGAGEITDIPVEIIYKNRRDTWTPSSLEDYGQISTLGVPQNAFKFGAVVYGTSDAKKRISQFLQEVKKAPKTDRSAKKTTRTQDLPPASPAPEATIPSAPEISQVPSLEEEKPSEFAQNEEKRRSEKEEFREFEMKFYVGENKKDTHLKTTEQNIEKILRTTTKDSEFKEHLHKYREDLNALAENYHEAAQDLNFSSSTTNFRVKSMCDDYSEAYRSFSKGDFGQSRIMMKRAREKRDELKGLLTK